ncbi:MAG: ABC transporter substrate-binding protein [Wenzhouxiangellaceae bacterium]|nr:ABC transporter substrate-binding protein [Wenzhouxiangellaceae bacterium]
MAAKFLQAVIATLVCLAAADIGRAQDDAGQDPARIVSLAPHLTELAFEAGIGDLLVGAVEWSDHPAAAREIPRIGDAFRFDLERILRMKASHALAWGGGTPSGALAKLRELGIDVEVIEIRTLAQIAGAIERLGQLGADPAAAAERAADFRRRLLAFDQGGPSGRPVVEIFYQVSEKPLFTLGGRHVINEVFGLCGAVNVFGRIRTEAASVDLEAVLARDPLAIVASDDGPGNPAAHWQAYPDLRAIACDNVLRVDPALLVRPTPRVLDGAAKLCEWLDRAVRPAENPACRTGRD